jgi:DNA-binding transcriptional MerR regulator
MSGMTAPYTIGELSRRTGLPVRTIRFYSDRGVVPPDDRTGSGYRLYGPDAVARLGLVRTLRELGIDLATIRRVLEREVGVAEAAAVHAAAIEAQIPVLRFRHGVLRAVAERSSDPEEMHRMHKLTRMSEEERRRIVAEFLDEAFADLDIDPEFAARMRAAQPELPDDPRPEQVEAWIELAELVRDDGFRSRIRQMSERHAETRPQQHPDWQEAARLVAEKAEGARVAGIDPASPEGRRIAAAIAPAFAGPGDDPDDAAWRAALADRIATGTDARAERYWQLLAIINGWPPVPTTVPAWEWLIAALRA